MKMNVPRGRPRLGGRARRAQTPRQERPRLGDQPQEPRVWSLLLPPQYSRRP